MLNTFVSNIAGRGLAPKNRYRISIAPPQTLDPPAIDIALMCESIEFPGQNFSSQPDQLRYGPSREMATGITFAPITATFMCSPDMYEKRFFENWQLLVIDMHSWEPRFYKDYIGGLKIYQLDRANNTTYVVELFEVYPKTITAQDLGYATNDAYHTIAVEFIYHHWERVIDRTPSKKATSESVKEGPIEWKIVASDSVKEGPIEKKTVTSDSIEAGPDEGTIYGHTIDKNQSTTGIQ